jgi:hypothetical protein
MKIGVDGYNVQSNNTTGFCGIYLVKKTGKYLATVSRDGKRKNLGTFATIDEARNAREKERETYCTLIR